MKLIMGLGNPGEAYARTRHNVGRRLIEFIASQEKVSFAVKKSQHAALASIRWEDEAVYLAHSLNYMNLSGEAAAAVVKYWKIDPEKDMLIVVDDIALPFGKFRLRGEGSAGGHNGLASIEALLGIRNYPRLRIGIGAPAQEIQAAGVAEEPLRDYVLSSFKSPEEKKMKGLLERGEAACRAWALEPLSKAMNRVNADGF
jgi:PTH1 family peptidyl-tRNA hydrolase